MLKQRLRDAVDRIVNGRILEDPFDSTAHALHLRFYSLLSTCDRLIRARVLQECGNIKCSPVWPLGLSKRFKNYLLPILLELHFDLIACDERYNQKVWK